MIYKGSHGDGYLTTLSAYEGNATNIDWPGINSINSRGVTNILKMVLRGGSLWDYGFKSYIEISG